MEWPQGNVPGNCWCGHEEREHAILNVEGRCTSCQCVGFILDRWVTNEL